MATQLVTRRLNLDVKGLAASAVKALLIKTAKEIHAEEVRRGFDPDPRRVIDGRFDAALESVKPFGRIILSERVPLDQAALWVYETLRARARPFRKTGRYEGSISIFVERTPVAPVLGAIRAALASQPDAAIVIAPVVIYARRLEKKYKPVDATYRMAANRFGKSMFVSKMSLYAGQIGGTVTVTRRFTHGKRLQKSLVVEAVYPAIRIYRRAGVGSYSVQ